MHTQNFLLRIRSRYNLFDFLLLHDHKLTIFDLIPIHFNSDTDFNVLRYLYNIGSAINQHGMTHTTSMTSSYDTWIYEFSTQKNEIKAYAKISEPIGSRAPYLQPNEAYYQAMTTLNIKFDSSMVNPDDKPYWPFTLDYQVPDLNLCQTFGSCPTSSHPGIWEFPLTSFDLSAIGNVMDYTVTEENYVTILNLYKGIYFHNDFLYF